MRGRRIFEINPDHPIVKNLSKILYIAYKKRTRNIEVDMDVYNRAKDSDPEFYHEASSIQYGKLLRSHHLFCNLIHGPMTSPWLLLIPFLMHSAYV